MHGACARHSVRGGVGASEEYEWGEDCGGSSAELICVAAYRAATSVATFKVNELIVLGARSNKIGKQSRASYMDHVTVYPYNGYIKSTNLIVRHVMSLTCTLKRLLVCYGTAKHAKTQHVNYSNTRA